MLLAASDLHLPIIFNTVLFSLPISKGCVKKIIEISTIQTLCFIEKCAPFVSKSLCFQTFTNSHWRGCLKKSHTQDMVMITPGISLEILEGEILVFVKQNNLKF